MRLPARDFDQFLGGRATGPPQQIQDLGGLAAVAGRVGLLSALGRFRGGAGLPGRLGFCGRGVARTSSEAGLLGGF